MVSGENQHKICANVFGRTQSRQSKAFSLFINHIYNKFHLLVHDNLDWWHRNSFHDSSAEAIEAKLIHHGYDFDADGQGNLFTCFIDCNCLPTSVVGGGLLKKAPTLCDGTKKFMKLFTTDGNL